MQINSKEDIRINTNPKKQIHKVPDYLFSLPQQYIEIYNEIISAVNSNLMMLACTGIRTIIDTIISEKVGNKGTFKDKLDKMKNEHYFSSTQYEIFSILINAGNASAHRGYSPNEKDMLILIESLDGFLKSEVDLMNLNQASQNIPPKPN